MEQKPQLPVKKRHTEDENDTLFQKLNKEVKEAPPYVKGIIEYIDMLENRLTELELYCYETTEVRGTISWDPSKCSPRKSQIQMEVEIWRRMNPQKSTIEELKKRVDKRSNNIGTKENPIVIN